MKLKQLIYGLATFIPALHRVFAKGTGGSDSARYCYSVWLRHLVMAKKNGLNPYPKRIAELGPGDSLGIGLAALISGCDTYIALDVIEHSNKKRNIAIFDEILALFKDRAAIPGEEEFPNVKPFLEDYAFPSDIFDDTRLQQALEPSRIGKIRNAIERSQREDALIQYKVPWYDADIVEMESLDMIYSQAVLEHVDDLRKVYKLMHLWLKSNGFMSHQIDFKSHGTADEWNGHWAYSDFMWKLIRGKRPYLLNRIPHSTHIAMMKEEGFDIVCDQTIETESLITKDQLAPQYKSLSDKDLITSGTFIQSVRKT